MLTELSDHGFSDETTGRKVAMLNDTLWDIESRGNWPWLEKTATLDFDGTNPNPTNIPTDFKTVLWLYDNTNGTTIWPERWSTIRDRHGNQINQVDNPVSYYFVGSQLRLWPVPVASTGRFQLDYQAAQTAITETSPESALLLPPQHHRVVVLGALWRLYKMEDDPENGAMFQQDYEDRIKRMADDLYTRQLQRADQIFVIDEDDEYLNLY